jgi:hypothetical protein
LKNSHHHIRYVLFSHVTILPIVSIFPDHPQIEVLLD